MSRFSARIQPVIVEYTFFDVPVSDLETLPNRVEEAVSNLVQRERLPSDENVREFIRENSENPAAANDGGESKETATDSASVQIMLPHDVAVDVALDRSFNTPQPPSESPLTTVDLRVLTRRSVKTRLKCLRRLFARDEVATPSEPPTCVICLDKVRFNRTKITLECEHSFHRGCIIKALKKLPRQCPTCRFEVNLTPRIYEEHIARPTRSTEHASETTVEF